MKLATKIQKAIWLKGRKISPLSLPRSVQAKEIMISTALNIARTPKSLSGIERKIA